MVYYDPFRAATGCCRRYRRELPVRATSRTSRAQSQSSQGSGRFGFRSEFSPSRCFCNADRLVHAGIGRQPPVAPERIVYHARAGSGALSRAARAKAGSSRGVTNCSSVAFHRLKPSAHYSVAPTMARAKLRKCAVGGLRRAKVRRLDASIPRWLRSVFGSGGRSLDHLHRRLRTSKSPRLLRAPR